MEASQPEDVESILAKISDKEEFNEEIQSLIFSVERRTGTLQSLTDSVKL